MTMARKLKASFVDGDHMILHVHAVREPGTRGAAIVEHWDAVQPIPEKSANGNTMFQCTVPACRCARACTA